MSSTAALDADERDRSDITFCGDTYPHQYSVEDGDTHTVGTFIHPFDLFRQACIHPNQSANARASSSVGTSVNAQAGTKETSLSASGRLKTSQSDGNDVDLANGHRHIVTQRRNKRLFAQTDDSEAGAANASSVTAQRIDWPLFIEAGELLLTSCRHAVTLAASAEHSAQGVEMKECDGLSLELRSKPIWVGASAVDPAHYVPCVVVNMPNSALSGMQFSIYQKSSAVYIEYESAFASQFDWMEAHGNHLASRLRLRLGMPVFVRSAR